MQTRLDPLSLLERADKWYLGGGRAALYAPAFPQHLETPGYWDEVHYADVRLERLYCLLLLDERGRPLGLRRALRRWTPDRLTLLYTVEGSPGLRVQEERTVSPDDTLACRLTLTHTGPLPLRLHLILWSLQTQRILSPDPFTATVEAVEHAPDALSFAHCVQDGHEEPEGAEARHRLFVALGADRPPTSWTVNLAESAHTVPLWQVSMLLEKFRNGLLPGEMRAVDGSNPEGLLHLMLHYEVMLTPGKPEAVTVGAALALERDVALSNLRADMGGDVLAHSRAGWRAHFASVPHFTCSDPFLERYYWYRWYGLRLLTVRVRAGQLPYPCIFEGIGAFRSHISASAPCHLREASWMHDPTLAQGCLENFLAHQLHGEDQLGDGLLPDHLTLWRRDRSLSLSHANLSHANWGAAARQLYHLTGDLAFVRRIYPGLVRYAEYFDRERDREESGLYDGPGQEETGQATMPPTLFVDRASYPEQAGPIRVKGVDATCTLYELQRALALFARTLGQAADAAWWDEKADATRQAIRELMWDPADAWYKNVDPQTLAPVPAKAAVGFYPFMSDIATRLQVAPLRAHLHDPSTFGTPYPVPTCSVDDPRFAAGAEWMGKRTNRPWNGRVWPMTNSHVADALAHAGRTLSADMRAEAADFIQSYVYLLFHEGDPKRPNCYEHYNPLTGMPSLYRGIDDHQRSWIVDLILRHVAGVQPEPDANGALIIDPLPFELSWFHVEDIRVRGHRIDIDWNRTTGFGIIVDGEERVRLPERARVELIL